MKKITFLLLFVCATTFYAQNIPVGGYGSNIEFEPAEVSSSAILNFSFSEAKTIKYVVTLDDKEVLSAEVSKKEGGQIMKTDLSPLENGRYTIHFIIDGAEVKKIPFKKI